jgi:hypothetical protein
MPVPTPVGAVAAFASFVRGQLAELSGTLTPLLSRRSDAELVVRRESDEQVGAARHLAMVIIGAAAPFAPTSHARARLLRQAHASGLLSDHETEQALHVERLAISGGPADGDSGMFGASG